MARYQSVKIVSLPKATGANSALAVADAVRVNATGQVEHADAVTETVVGTVAEAAGVNDEAVAIALVQGGGIGICRASAAITRGHAVEPSATDGEVAGEAQNAITAGRIPFGIALQAATGANQYIEVLFGYVGQSS